MPSSGVQTCALDRKSTRLNSSHGSISYAVFFLKKNTRLEPRATHIPQSPLCSSYITQTPPSRQLDSGVSVGANTGNSSLRLPVFFFFFKEAAPPELSPLSHHDSLLI